MSKRDAETEPAGSDAPALRQAGADINPMLLNIQFATDTVASCQIKVERDRAIACIVSKRKAETVPASPVAPAMRHAADDINAILMNVRCKSDTWASCHIKVERDLALELGLAKEWNRLVELCKTNTDVNCDNNNDWTAISYLSCATHQLRHRGKRLAKMRFEPIDEIDILYYEEFEDFTDTEMFAKGALPGGIVCVWQG